MNVKQQMTRPESSKYPFTSLVFIEALCYVLATVQSVANGFENGNISGAERKLDK